MPESLTPVVFAVCRTGSPRSVAWSRLTALHRPPRLGSNAHNPVAQPLDLPNALQSKLRVTRGQLGLSETADSPNEVELRF